MITETGKPYCNETQPRHLIQMPRLCIFQAFACEGFLSFRNQGAE